MKATVTFAHDGSETSSGSFTYTVSDGTASDTATVTANVIASNDAPIATDDTTTVAEGGSVAIAAPTLLANDSDADGDDLSLTAVAAAVNGTVTPSRDKLSGHDSMLLKLSKLPKDKPSDSTCRSGHPQILGSFLEGEGRRI